MANAAVAKVESKAVAIAEDVEWESDGAEEIAVHFPQIDIVQGTSKMEGAGRHGGFFYHRDREEFEEVLAVIPLRMTYQQALFEEGAEAPSCASNDGAIPRPNQPLWSKTTFRPRGEKEDRAVPLLTQPKSCDACPLHGWEDGKPPCSRSILLLVEREDGSYAQLRFGGKSLKPFQYFVSHRLVNKNKRLPLFTHRFTLRTAEKAEDGKKWYELMVDGELLPVAEQRRYNALVASMRSQLTQAVADSQPESEAPPENDGWGDGTQSFAPEPPPL